MRLVFRADASMNIGVGHVMRCFSLAEEATSRGLECILVGTVNQVKWLLDKVLCLGFSAVIKPDDFTPQRSRDVLILDSYTIELDDKFIRREKWKKIISVVDQQTPEYEADVVIHPGFDAAWYKGDKRKLLTGPSYLPLRKSIVKNYRHIPKKIDNIVVFGGGTDFYGFGLQIARIIKDFEDFNSAIFFSDQRKEIETLDGRFSVLDFGFNFDEHIAKSDLVLTTASTSCLEILARELPLGIAQAIDNQKNTFQIFGNKGFAAQIGERLPSGEWRMNLSNISNLITDSEFRNKLVAKSKDVVDLNGAKRIIDKVIE